MSAATSEGSRRQTAPNQCHGLKPSCSEIAHFLEQIISSRALGRTSGIIVFIEDFGIFPISLWQSPWYQFIILESGLAAPKGENCWRLTLPRLVTHCSFPRWRSRTKQCSRWKNSVSLEARGPGFSPGSTSNMMRL